MKFEIYIGFVIYNFVENMLQRTQSVLVLGCERRLEKPKKSWKELVNEDLQKRFCLTCVLLGIRNEDTIAN